jgi:hypothetical protein
MESLNRHKSETSPEKFFRGKIIPSYSCHVSLPAELHAPPPITSWSDYPKNTR